VQPQPASRASQACAETHPSRSKTTACSGPPGPAEPLHEGAHARVNVSCGVGPHPAQRRVVDGHPRHEVPQHLAEDGVVVRPIARVEDRECDAVESVTVGEDRLTVTLRHLPGRAAEGTAAEGAEDGVPDAVLPQRGELGLNAPAHLRAGVRLARALTTVNGRGPELEPGEDFILPQPAVAKGGVPPVLAAAHAHPRVLRIEVHPPPSSAEERGDARCVAAGALIEGGRGLAEVAGGAPEQVLLLRGHPLDIPSAKDDRIRHVRHSVHGAVEARELARKLQRVRTGEVHRPAPRARRRLTAPLRKIALSQLQQARPRRLGAHHVKRIA
jgi:hypothetical protein